jgi:hypothetical protein
MNDRALEFLDHWESEHVEAVPQNQRGEEAIRLAAMCREDAIRAGVAIRDLEEVAKGDLVANMKEALEAAAAQAE